MKVGDLIRVKYYENKNIVDCWYHGVLIDSITAHGPSFDIMWCAETGSTHVLQRNKDLIEVLCESSSDKIKSINKNCLQKL